MKEEFSNKIQGDKIEEHIEYCLNLLKTIESKELMIFNEKVRILSNYLREMIEDNLYIS